MLSHFLPILMVSFATVGSAFAGDICGNLDLEQCKQASKAAIEQRERALGINSRASQYGVYTDKYNKLSWSTKLPGTYSNGCVDANGRYDSSKCTFDVGADGNRQVRVADSNAAKACEDSGKGTPFKPRLPTKQEYESLIRNFDHTEESYGPRLTDKGIAAMQTIFGDMNNWFWSSSVSSNDSYGAYVLNGVSGGVDYVIRDYYNYAVRCVAGR